MTIKEITLDEFSDFVSSLSRGYTLFEAELLQDGDYNRQSQELPDTELPDAKTAEELLDAVDAQTLHTKIWDDTQFDTFKDNGPILSSFNEGTELLKQYLESWGDWHVGVFIDALDENSLVQHLRSLLLVKIPPNKEVHYRLQETRKLAGILKAIDGDSENKTNRISQLLGPIKDMVWQENCGTDKTYYHVSNTKPEETLQVAGWFHFTPEEQEKIELAEIAWHKRSIVSTLQTEIAKNQIHTQHLNKYNEKEIEGILDRGYGVAIKNNIRKDDNLSFFLLNNLLYPEFMNSKDIARITSQRLWLEPKKIELIKTKLDDYLLTLNQKDKKQENENESNQKKGIT